MFFGIVKAVDSSGLVQNLLNLGYASPVVLEKTSLQTMKFQNAAKNANAAAVCLLFDVCEGAYCYHYKKVLITDIFGTEVRAVLHAPLPFIRTI